MCSVEPLREFIRQRLCAAAEEIFSEVENTFRLLEIGWRNQINQELTELQQQEVLDDQQLWSQDRNHGSDQRETEPWTGRDEEQLPLKQEETLSAPHILEIFGASEIGPDRFEEETDLRRRLLATDWKPVRKSHRTEPPRQPVSEEKVLTDRRPWNWSLYQNQSEPPQVKQNQEEPEPPLKQEYQDEPEPLPVKQNQDHPLILQNSETSTAPTDEESNQTEPEPNSEEVRDQDGFCKPEESEPDQRSKVKRKRTYAESSSGSDSVDEGGEGFLVRRKGPSAEPEPSTSSASRELSSFRETPAATRSRRPRSAESLYCCDTCGKRFRFKCRYQSHVRTHTGEKPFTCRQCGKSFTQGGSLWRHVRTHSGEKPFLCMTCGRSFSQKTGLLGHIRTQHAADKPTSG